MFILEREKKLSITNILIIFTNKINNKATPMIIAAQTTCNGGTGRVVYERLPDQQLQGFDDDVVSGIMTIDKFFIILPPIE